MSNSKLLTNKISSQIRHQFPEFIQSDHPVFIRFLEIYYQFLESCELTLSGSNDYIVQETDFVYYILDENNDKIVLEEFNSDVQYGSSSKFIQGEEIYGETTFARAKILVDDFDSSSKLYVSSQQGFQIGERVRGVSSNAVAILLSYRGNPVQNIQQFLSYVDVDNTITDFFTEFKNAFLEFIPTTTASNLSQRNLVKNIRELYSAKGTANAHKLFFRILFDEESFLIYPRQNILRTSDGQWSSDKIMRVIEQDNSDFNNLIGQEIYSLDRFGRRTASAIVSTVVKFREGSNLISQLNLDSESIVGEFVAEDIVFGVDPNSNLEISATAKSIVTTVDVTDRGFNYDVSDVVNIGEGGNNTAFARIASIGSGSLTEIVIENGGTGYTVDDEIYFNTLDTNGKDAVAEISVVGGSILLENETSPDLMYTEDGYILITENAEGLNYIQLESSESDDYLLNENDETLVIESETFNDVSAPDEIGEITRIKIINGGNAFTKLPLLSVISSTGQDAEIFAISTEQPGIGYVKEVRITNFGLGYNVAPDLYFNRKLIVKNVTGSFISGETITSHNAVVVQYDSERHILELKSSINFLKGDIIQSITGSTAEVYFTEPANAVANIGVIGTTISDYITDRGKISNSSMRIQDSYYYQDYSYVVRVGQSINEWRESLRQSVHPSGWNFFGEVSFSSRVSASIARVDTRFGGIPLAEFAPAIIGVLFGRRLGTKHQGILRNNSNESVANLIDLDNTDKFTGDGSTTTYSITKTSLKDAVNLNVKVDGVVQIYGSSNDYKLLNGKVVFNSAPSNGAEIIVERIKPSVYGQNYNFQGDGSTTLYTLTDVSEVSSANVEVFVDNVLQVYGSLNDYLIISNSLIFNNAPASGAKIRVLQYQRDLTLSSFVRVRAKYNRGYHRREYGTLAQIPKYAFVTAKTNDTEPASNWVGLNRVISNKNAIDGEYHTLSQIGNYKINELCDTSFVLLDDGLDGDGDKILLEEYTEPDNLITEDGFTLITETFEGSNTLQLETTDSGYLKDEIFDIPSQAYQTYLNIPPPGEIIISNPSSIAGFDESVHTFDQTDLFFDEGGISDIGRFDSNINTFDEELTNTFDEKL